MCRELRREPAWVAAIRLAILEGQVTTEAVIEEANLVPGRERTVRDILSKMADRGVLNAVGEDEYLPGETLLDSDRYSLDFSKASDGAAHRWQSSV